MPGRSPKSRDELSEAIAAQVNEQILRTVTGRGRLPDGVITILFTDVEGSTELVSGLGDEQARMVLRRHDEEVRRAIEAHDGTEVERAGDSFMAAFRLPRQALACALERPRRCLPHRQGSGSRTSVSTSSRVSATAIGCSGS